MGASQDQGIDLPVFQGMEIASENHFGFPLGDPALFNEGNEQRAGR